MLKNSAIKKTADYGRLKFILKKRGRLYSKKKKILKKKANLQGFFLRYSAAKINKIVVRWMGHESMFFCCKKTEKL